MVKRTGEVVMGIIGVVLSALFSVFGFIFMAGMNTPEFEEVFNEMENDPALTAEDTNMILSAFDSMGWYLIILGILALILGVIGVIAIVGNKKPKLAGIMFIIAAVVVGLGSVGVGFIPAILFLIAGIMSLVRKPKEPVY
ncbi:DUF4064 domain-containing protein [Bacillus seohaeanensis]|uniref:DUF4064 domain-containing protein n=1 Tax=Bacillus seohaeanensis TaxID=284580 RepID=A0ABW5RV41_9BACI